MLHHTVQYIYTRKIILPMEREHEANKQINGEKMIHEARRRERNRKFNQQIEWFVLFSGQSTCGGDGGHEWIRSGLVSFFFSRANDVRSTTRLVDSYFAHTVDDIRDGRRAGSPAEHPSAAIGGPTVDRLHNW